MLWQNGFEMKTCTEIRGIKQASGCAIWKIIDFMVLWIIFPRTDCPVAFYPLTQSGISRRVQTALWKPRYTHQSIWLQIGTSQNEAEIPWLPSCEIILDMKITARACLVQHGRQEDMQQLQNRAAPRRRETDTLSFRPCSLSHPQTSGRLICPLKPSESRDESAGKANSVFFFFF